MAAHCRLLLGSAWSGKTTQLLDEFVQLTKAYPGCALWVSPTQRSVEAVRSRLSATHPSQWGARFSTFQEFVQDIIRCNDPRTQLLSPVQRRLLMEALLARFADLPTLSAFARVAETRGFMDGLLTLLDELQRTDVIAADFVRIADGFDDKTRQCALLFSAYELELAARQSIDDGTQARHACRLLSEGQRKPFEKLRAVFIDDFNDFSPAQHEVLRQLSAWVDDLWIALPDEQNVERAELYSQSRATVEKLQRLNPQIIPLDAPTLSSSRPAGILHLERQLFRPLRRHDVSADAAGIVCLEAPGMLGETRMVARRIKGLLLEGRAAPEDIVVTMRDFGPYVDLVSEVFADYGIPLEVEGSDPLTRSPAVSLLLRALRLADDDWPFAEVTALLRNTFFQPNWPEVVERPQLPQQAEALLRLLGEPRGRTAYLHAVTRWAEQQQPGLEDEQAQESRRRRTHELAKTCAPFLQRFFSAWDTAPEDASVAEHLRWVQAFAEELGIGRAAEQARDRAALSLLWQEAELWSRQHADHLDRRTFQRRLLALASAAGLPRSTQGTTGRVRLLSAPLARHLEAPYLFLMGMGERSFPRLASSPAILDEEERLALKTAGVELPCGDLLAEEMLLFYQLITRAGMQLVLSYPAVDERGQPLLPSSFLTAVFNCFTTGAIPIDKRRMLIEGIASEAPLSVAEYRVRVAALGQADYLSSADLPPDLKANLADAADLIRLRFKEREFNSYNGLFRDARVLADLRQLFGPERVFSPTALEDYVTCPFRFYLKNVLRLETLEEPKEGIEVTRRGQVYHRALARLHRQLKGEEAHQPDDQVPQRLAAEMQTAVQEDVQRAPSLAAKQLWLLEGERLVKQALRYGAQWQQFVKPWNDQRLLPTPFHFEVDFGLPGAAGQPAFAPLIIRDQDIEVRISGRIDRVDVAQVNGATLFWIIDYKTGSASNYTATDLASFRKLQLTLYALAVEEVLLAGQSARPLGLAYWLVAKEGARVVLPKKPLLWEDEAKHWQLVREQLRTWILTLVRQIRGGVFALQPRDEDCAQTCDFGQICRITQSRGLEKTALLPLPLLEAK